MRSGGFALSLPIVITLGSVLMLLNSLMALIIIGGLLTGDAIIAPYIGVLAIILALGVWSQLLLFRGVFKYTGGIGKLWSRLRGIQDEQARINQLIDNNKQTHDDDMMLDYESEDIQYKRQS